MAREAADASGCLVSHLHNEMMVCPAADSRSNLKAHMKLMTPAGAHSLWKLSLGNMVWWATVGAVSLGGDTEHMMESRLRVVEYSAPYLTQRVPLIGVVRTSMGDMSASLAMVVYVVHVTVSLSLGPPWKETSGS